MSTRVFLDHVGIAVRDLAGARADWERLGFTTTPLSLHASPRQPGGAVEPSGSGNHCIMLEAGYIELLGIAGPGDFNTAAGMLARYEGAHILALGSKDAAASRAAVAALGFAITPPTALERDAPFGPAGQETRRAAFANAYLEAVAFPEAHAFIIEHRTPDVVWQPHQMRHGNGAVGLSEAWLCPADPAAAAARYARLTGSEARETGDAWLVPLPRGTLRLTTAAAFAARTGQAPPAVPGMSGLAVTVRDLGAAEALLASRGVAFRHDPQGLLVTGTPVHGAALLLTAAAA